MADILVGQSLADKDMPEVSAAVLAEDLRPSSIGIEQLTNGTRNLIVKTWPATAGMKLVLRTIEWGVAATTDIGPVCFVVE